jgi:hypothetical protein
MFLELMMLSYGPEETVRDFCNRVAEKMRENNLPSNATFKLRGGILKKILLFKCPDSVKNTLGHKTVDDFGSWKELAVELSKF